MCVYHVGFDLQLSGAFLEKLRSCNELASGLSGLFLEPSSGTRAHRKVCHLGKVSGEKVAISRGQRGLPDPPKFIFSPERGPNRSTFR